MIDHLRNEGKVKALSEVARVLKPRGEFLLLIVNADWMTRLFSPHALGHHPRQDPARWRTLLDQAGFAIEEEGTDPATLYGSRGSDNRVQPRERLREPDDYFTPGNWM